MHFHTGQPLATGSAMLEHAAIERLATLLGDELEAFEDKTAEVFREDGYNAGWEDGLAAEREEQEDIKNNVYAEGYDVGYDSGYDQGYSEGFDAADGRG